MVLMLLSLDLLLPSTSYQLFNHATCGCIGSEVVDIRVLEVPMKKENGDSIIVPLFQSRENIFGEVAIEPILGKKVEYTGVKIELLGQIGQKETGVIWRDLHSDL